MTTPSAPQERIAAAYERFFERHGDNFRGVGWTKSQGEVDLRFKVMLELVDPQGDPPVALLDFGCGLGHLYEYLKRRPPTWPYRYSGLDISERLLEAARTKHPGVEFFRVDLLKDDAELPAFDYVLMNGVFTYKEDVSQDAMLEYWQQLLVRAFEHARYGLAFNVMSREVEWERDDLFHLSFDTLAGFVSKRLSRHFVIRHDYPLYEYTTYVYREARGANTS